jgi:hypothetical protein
METTKRFYISVEKSTTPASLIAEIYIDAITNKDNDACMKAFTMILNWGGVLWL